MAAMCMAATSVINAEIPSQLRKENNPFYNGQQSTITLGGRDYNFINHKSEAATRSDITDENGIIVNPIGTERLYSKEAAGTGVVGNNMVAFEDTFPSSVVWGENDEVYVKDIISAIPIDAYIKGTIKDDVISFDTGQLIAYIPDDPDTGQKGYGIAVGMVHIEFEGNEANFYYDSSIYEFSMKLNADGSLQLVLPGDPYVSGEIPEYAIGLYYTDEFAFIGWSDFYQYYTPEDYEVINMPAGVEVHPYVFIDEDDYATIVEVAFTDKYLYIKGLDPMMEESVVRADIEGNRAIIPQNQYQGVYMDQFFVFTKVYADNPDYNPWDPDSVDVVPLPVNEGFELKIDTENGLIYADTPGVYLIFTPDFDTLEYALCTLSEFELRYQDSLSGTPANPSELAFNPDWFPYYGYGDFSFNLSNHSTRGTLLDQDYILYQVLLDGEPIIFEEKEITTMFGYDVLAYTHVPGKQRWLNYNFSNGEDIDRWWGNQYHIGIYDPRVDRLGVQSIYVYEEPYTYSELVTLDVLTGDVTVGAVGSVESNVLKKVEYYTLSGVKVKEPGNGIFIRKAIYQDGTVRTRKVMR